MTKSTKQAQIRFSEHEIYTVRDKGWDGKKNGELMRLMVDNLSISSRAILVTHILGVGASTTKHILFKS